MPETMVHIRARTVECNADEEIVIRRLGRAIALLWKEISTETQERLLEQSALVDTGKLNDELMNMTEQMEHLIGKLSRAGGE